MEISFCVPTYNRAEYLKRCVDSVLAENDHDIEVIVQDNCSPDHTPELMATYKDPRLQYYRNSHNVGGDQNIISIIARASGRYIYYLTDDAYLLPDGMAKLKDFIHKNDPCFFTSHIKQYFEKSDRFYNYYFFDQSIDAMTKSDKYITARIIYSARYIPRMCFKRELLDYDLLKKHSDNWYPHMVIPFQIYLKGSLYYLAEPVLCAHVENESYGLPLDLDETERGLFNIVKIMSAKLDYEIVESFILHFCHMRGEISDVLLNLLKPESQTKLKAEADNLKYRVL